MSLEEKKRKIKRMATIFFWVGLALFSLALFALTYVLNALDNTPQGLRPHRFSSFVIAFSVCGMLILISLAMIIIGLKFSEILNHKTEYIIISSIIGGLTIIGVIMPVLMRFTNLFCTGHCWEQPDGSIICHAVRCWMCHGFSIFTLFPILGLLAGIIISTITVAIMKIAKRKKVGLV